MNATDTQSYVLLLEKTNQQLSLWYNPYAVMIAVLTALVALLAISFAYILWRQGKEYKDAFKAFIEEQRQIAETERKKFLEDSEKAVNKAIEEDVKKLESATGEKRAQLEKQIIDLKKASAELKKTDAYPASVATVWRGQEPGGVFRDFPSLSYNPLAVTGFSPYASRYQVGIPGLSDHEQIESLNKKLKELNFELESLRKDLAAAKIG